eukprot:COSAG06_NODE_5821_length_3257_cov_8.634386_4_plen_312_part_01
MAQDGWALKYASAALRGDAQIVREAVAKNGLALQYASEALRGNPQIVREAVAQNSWALEYASAALRGDAQIVREVVARHGYALQFASAELRQQHGDTAPEFLASVAAAEQSAAAATGATGANPTKKRKLDPDVEARLAILLGSKQNADDPPLRTLSDSAFLRSYDSLPTPRSGEQLWADPLAAVAVSLPRDFRREEWEQALRDVAQQQESPAATTSALARAGAACARLWSKNAMFRLVQQVVLSDDLALLERIMPFVRCLNAFVLDEKGLLQRKTTVHRLSRMSRSQAGALQPGQKYRLGMYVATSTRKGAT